MEAKPITSPTDNFQNRLEELIQLGYDPIIAKNTLTSTNGVIEQALQLYIITQSHSKTRGREKDR